ncbi:MAG: lactonase family protein [Bryobacteraceae bacterium]|nr:lactonase family protein [Bryobacteraceae bacterium]
MKLLRYLLPLALLAPLLPAAEYFVYFGTYTRPEGGKGIYVARFDSTTGKVGEPTLAAETSNPSFVAIHPNHRFLYAVSESYGQGGEKAGAVTSFAIDRATGKLKSLNTVSSKGGGPCHLNVDKTGKCVSVANYGTGSVAALPIKEDGTLGEATAFIQHAGSSADPKRQRGPHAHSVNYSADNRFLIAADLGLDQVIVYRFDPAKCSLAANDPPYAKVNGGAGPRHFTFHPKGRFAYAINEMQNTVTAFSWDAAKGALKEIQTISTLPDGYSSTSYTAEVVAHPSGKFLYGSNRGHDSIAVFTVDASKGTLKPVEQTSTQGKVPRNFNIDPTGAWLFAANQDTDNVVMFKIDQQTGRLSPTGQVVKVFAPVCVRFLPVE